METEKEPIKHTDEPVHAAPAPDPESEKPETEETAESTPPVENAAPAQVEAPAQDDKAVPQAPSVQRSPSLVPAILLLAIGFLLLFTMAFLFFTKDTDKTAAGSQNKTPAATAPAVKSIETSSLSETAVRTSVTYGTQTVSVDYPKVWKLINMTTTKSDGSTVPLIAIESTAGNHIIISANTTTPGECAPANTDTYTLTKKIATQTPTVFFTEYSVTSGPRDGKVTESLFLENFATKNAADTTRKEGDSAKNTCAMQTTKGSVGDLIVHVSKSTTIADTGSYVYFSDIATDADFVTALKSLTVTKS